MNENLNHDIDLKEIVTTHILSLEVIIELMRRKASLRGKNTSIKSRK